MLPPPSASAKAGKGRRRIPTWKPKVKLTFGHSMASMGNRINRPLPSASLPGPVLPAHDKKGALHLPIKVACRMLSHPSSVINISPGNGATRPALAFV